MLAAALAGCGGGGGSTDSSFAVPAVPGAPGAGVTAVAGAPPAPPAPAGTAPVTLTATTPAATIAALAPVAAVGGVAINSPPMVTFSVADAAGNPIIGLGYTKQSATQIVPQLANLSFSLAKLVPGKNGSPSKWVSYIVTSMPSYKSATDKTIVPATPTRPSTDNTGTLTDYKNGIYVYKFYRDIKNAATDIATLVDPAGSNHADLGDVSYDPTLVHRLTIQYSGNAWGTSTQTPTGADSGVAALPVANPFNIVYDFIPATGKAVTASDTSRDIVATAKCQECHGVLTNLGFHGAGRYETKYCVVCHTDQRKYGRTEAAFATGSTTAYTGSTNVINGFSAGDLPAFIHRLHKGEMLSKTGYSYGGIPFNEVKYPQDIRNCVKCHDGTTGAKNATAKGDNWKAAPSRLACGACHDKVKFSDGTNHEGGAMADDSLCALCHTAASIKAYHVPGVPPDLTSAANGGTNTHTNEAWVAAYPNNLPAGASKITYVLNKVSVVDGVPSMEFKFQKDGTDVVFNDPTVKTDMMDNFVGAPGMYFAFGVKQDGIAAPLDWNATISGNLKNIWNGKQTGAGKGTLTGPVGGWYTYTVTGSKIPTDATQIIGGIGYTYGSNTPPITQINVASTTKSLTNVARAYAYNATNGMGGVAVPAPNVNKVASVTVAGKTVTNNARRQIVSNEKCNDCHAALGVFTESVYHAGQRNDAPTCVFCHNVNRVNSGWGVNIKEAIHSLHGKSKREQKYSWEASAGIKFWEVTYPNKLNNCEACHFSGTYDFSSTTAAAAANSSNLLWTTVATGTAPTPLPTIVTGTEVIPGTYWSPWVTAGTVYGTGFSASFTASPATITDAAATTLISSPIASACFACHDSTKAKTHMESQGGKLYAARSTATPSASTETCLFCHSNTASMGVGIKAVHAKFK